MAAISQDDSVSLQVDNVLNVSRWMWPITWILVLIPLFFFIGGFSNWTSWRRVVARGIERNPEHPPSFSSNYRAFIRRRLGGLLTPLIPFLLLVLACVGLALLLGAPTELTLTVAVVVVMPLWFIAVFAALALIAPVMMRLDARYGWRVVLGPSIAVVVVDVAHMWTDSWYVGLANYVLVWGTAQQLGFAYADGRLQSLSRAKTAWWAVGAFAALVAVTASPWWPESMIGLAGERSNFDPPGTAPLLLTLVQVPIALLLRPIVMPRLDRPRLSRVLDVASNNSMRAFLWHLPVLVAVTGVMLLVSIPFPDPGSAAWWLSRIPWFAVLGTCLWGVLAGGDWLRGRLVSRESSKRRVEVGDRPSA